MNVGFLSFIFYYYIYYGELFLLLLVPTLSSLIKDIVHPRCGLVVNEVIRTMSLELEKRSKEVAQKAATDDADVRRSTRVRAPPRDNPAVAFLKCEVTVPILHMMFIYRLVSGAGAGAGLGACWVGFSSEWCSSATSVARGSPIRCVDEFLVDVSNSESGYLSNSTNTSLKVADSIPQSPNSAGDSKEFDANIASKDARQVEIPEDAARVVVEQAEKDNKGTPHTIRKILWFAVPILILIFHLPIYVQRLFPTCLLIVHRIIIMVTYTWLCFQGLTALCWMKLLIYRSNHWRLHVIAEMIVIRLAQCQLHQMKALWQHDSQTKLEAAYELLLTIPIKANSVVWRAFLAATRLHGNADLAEVSVKQDLLEKQLIPNLQRQVTSLTGQLQCLAEDLAEVSFLTGQGLILREYHRKKVADTVIFTGKQAKVMNVESGRGGVEDKGPLPKAKRTSLKVASPAMKK
ncbi:hypothetical protein T459_29043 [Capsicum annuum]|uniref:Uncharacterized protein n=1 Tax=Capsicum annuum TaxID=4072 RepID=A0A2G2Y4G3_CAPAN|nr:hypothetical protein T459_29043 [Capsicum annuum]